MHMNLLILFKQDSSNLKHVYNHVNIDMLYDEYFARYVAVGDKYKEQSA